MDAVHFSSEKHDWETPQQLFEVYQSRYGLNLDVCANEFNHKTEEYFSKFDDGLSRDWSSYRCWMNPPYGRAIKDWVRKAYEESQNGAIVVGLLPSRTDTSWFHDYIYGKAEVKFLRGRVKFLEGGKERHPAPFPSMIVIWG